MDVAVSLFGQRSPSAVGGRDGWMQGYTLNGCCLQQGGVSPGCRDSLEAEVVISKESHY